MNAIPSRLRIATRESRLAMRQATIVAAALAARIRGLAVELVGMTTRGDQVLDRPLAQVGGKGLFVKELEVAIDEGRADIAVHSLKDVPMQVPAQFALATFGPREDPRDAFVSASYASLASMPAGAVVGTSSLRRECQLRALYPTLAFRALRGNVNTRLAKLDAGDYDAIILAAAGLKRLDLAARIRATLDETIPAIGQGILAVEYRRERADIAALLEEFETPEAACAARAERALGLVVEGSCEVPVGALARVTAGNVVLEGFIGMPDGTRLVRDHASGRCEDAQSLGVALGEKLLAAGGREILKNLARASA
ncbi:MAG: hydroxymethylbilane synthase [Usitatibacter sp.]